MDYGLLVFGDGTESGVERIQWYGISAPLEGEKMYHWATTPGLAFSSTPESRAVAYQASDATTDFMAQPGHTTVLNGTGEQIIYFKNQESCNGV